MFLEQSSSFRLTFLKLDRSLTNRPIKDQPPNTESHQTQAAVGVVQQAQTVIAACLYLELLET